MLKPLVKTNSSRTRVTVLASGITPQKMDALARKRVAGVRLVGSFHVAGGDLRRVYKTPTV